MLILTWTYIFAETYDEARKKLPKATDTSNLDTDDEEILGKRRRRKNKIFDDEFSDFDSNEEIIPVPPKFKKVTDKQPLTSPIATSSKRKTNNHATSPNLHTNEASTPKRQTNKFV